MGASVADADGTRIVGTGFARCSTMNVQALMSTPVRTCQRDQTAQAALRVMGEHDCGCVLVVDDGVLIGIVTDRDIALALARADLRPSQIRLAQLISGHVFIVRPESPVAEAEAVMRQQQVRRIPVVDERSRPVGLLSLNDIARAGEAHEWSADDGLGAPDVAATLAAICEPPISAARAMA